MPIYEYICVNCRKKMSFLVMSPSTFEPACKFCKSTKLERIWSRFATPKSEDARLESLADPSTFAGLDENDPASVARWMKRMGREMGEDFGEDIDQIAEEAAEEAARPESAEPGGPEDTAAPTPGPNDDL